MLVKNYTGTIAANAAVKFQTQSTYVVEDTASTGDYAIGANDLSGVTITSGQYFWITVRGPATFLLATSIAAFTQVSPSATAGTLAADAADNVQANIVSAVSSGTGGATLCWIY
jgi:hypothetical protein